MNFKQHSYNGGLSFYEAVKKQKTLNIWSRINDNIIPCLTTSHDTIFKEIKRDEYKSLPGLKELSETITRQGKNDTKNYHKNLFDVICGVIEKTWNPKKLHVIGHSGGWDSRVLSESIKTIYKKNGSDWLGDVLFVENHGEHEQFIEIMKRQGWTKKQYLVYNEENFGLDYHKHSFDIETYYKKFDGICCFPVNQWFDPYQALGITDCQFFTGYGANEIDEYGVKQFNSIEKYAEWHHNIQLSWFNYTGDCIHPFWDEDWIKAIFYYSDIKNHKERITESMQILFPHLKDIPRLEYSDLAKKGFRSLSEDLIRNIKTDYDLSWYGTQIKSQVTNEFNYTRWWADFCAASICEYAMKLI